MRKVAVVGVGMTKFGKHEKTNMEMIAEASMDAINSSNITPKDIQALFVSNCLAGFEEGQLNMGGFVASELGIAGVPATRFEGACATGSMATRDAYNWVASGFYDIVLVAGTERALSMGTPLATRTFAMASDALYEGFCGLTFPGVFGLIANLYSKTYDVPMETLKESMATIAVKAHKNGANNPKAHFQKPITMEKALGAPMIADPLQLFDCCPFSDGGAALVLASEEVARKLSDTPVYIAGVGQSSAGNLGTQTYLPRLRSRELAAEQSYKMAGLEPKDIDVVELHDCFTIAEIVASEGLGFFEHGKGCQAALDGVTQMDGKIPINPSGGLKAKGHPIGATGAAQVVEIVEQLRGEADKRQVSGAEIGMTDTLGGDGGTLCNIILRR